MSPSTRTRKVVVVDNSHVARRVGDRIKQARTRAGLTQAQVAEGRYTAAYISALERGLAKPSMAALTFLSERLGVAVPDLVSEQRPALGRLEADLMLASGEYEAALDRYDALLEEAGADRRIRAELLRGRAEALCRLDRGEAAIRPAAEAAELFDNIGAEADAAWARYWLAGAHYLTDNTAEAQGIYQQLLARERAGIQVAPDFRFRLLTQLGNTEAWDGSPQRAVAYMEEARSLLGDISLRQRAAFLSGLSLHYRRAGDLEGSIRVGHESLALYHAADAEREEAALEGNIAMTYLELGNATRRRSPTSVAHDRWRKRTTMRGSCQRSSRRRRGSRSPPVTRRPRRNGRRRRSPRPMPAAPTSPPSVRIGRSLAWRSDRATRRGRRRPTRARRGCCGSIGPGRSCGSCWGNGPNRDRAGAMRAARTSSTPRRSAGDAREPDEPGRARPVSTYRLGVTSGCRCLLWDRWKVVGKRCCD